MKYPTSDLARAGGIHRSASPWYRSLNGTLEFYCSDNPAARPAKFFETSFDDDDDDWKTIPVPSNWQLQGFDVPVMTNITYPFPKHPLANTINEDSQRRNPFHQPHYIC